MIEPLAARLSNYFHFFGVRGAFLMQLGRNDEARDAFDRAIALANTSAEAAHIRHASRPADARQPAARRESGEVELLPLPQGEKEEGRARKNYLSPCRIALTSFVLETCFNSRSRR